MASKYLKNSEGIVRAITSDNLQLEKPLLNENYDIEVHNRNMDKIDGAIQNLRGTIDGLELTATNVTMTDGTTVEEKIQNNVSEIINLKQSVSDGKSLIASAITDKGLTTSNDATFNTMATNINKMIYLKPGSIQMVDTNGYESIAISKALDILKSYNSMGQDIIATGYSSATLEHPDIFYTIEGRTLRKLQIKNEELVLLAQLTTASGGTVTSDGRYFFITQKPTTNLETGQVTFSTRILDNSFSAKVSDITITFSSAKTGYEYFHWAPELSYCEGCDTIAFSFSYSGASIPDLIVGGCYKTTSKSILSTWSSSQQKGRVKTLLHNTASTFIIIHGDGISYKTYSGSTTPTLIYSKPINTNILVPVMGGYSEGTKITFGNLRSHTWTDYITITMGLSTPTVTEKQTYSRVLYDTDGRYIMTKGSCFYAGIFCANLTDYSTTAIYYYQDGKLLAGNDLLFFDNKNNIGLVLNRTSYTLNIIKSERPKIGIYRRR